MSKRSDVVNVMPGIIDRRSGLSPQAIEAIGARLPAGFPKHIWNRQSEFYRDYWAWFTGDYLAEKEETADNSDAHDPQYKYPLGINPVVDFSRKLADVFWGQVQDGPDALVKTAIKPKMPLNGDVASDDDQKRAKFLQNLVNEVWSSSNGRALQAENSILSQFLGGCYFQVCWMPDLEDELLVPIVVKNHPPDCVLPLWNPENPWELLEVFILYRVDNATAKRQYGYEGVPNSPGYMVYAEHWTKDTYSVYLNGKPMQDEDFIYENVPNPFGFVPVVYIPRFREGNFYGSSLVDDIRGLALELNSRLADVGDALQDATHREIFVRNLQNPGSIVLNEDTGLEATNLGNTRHGIDHQPDAFSIDPPTITESLAKNPDVVRQYLLRAGSMSTVAYGEDEGSQRSGVTLEIRLWPMLAITRLQRTFWEHGLNLMASMIIKMAVVKNIIRTLDPGVTITRKDLLRMRIHQDWATQVPRDRALYEQTLLNRLAAHGISIDRFLELIGERDVTEEHERILADLKEILSLESQFAATQTSVSEKANATGSAISSVTKTEPLLPQESAVSEE